MSARVKRSVTRRRHREVQSSGLLLTWDGEEGGKRRREGGRKSCRMGWSHGDLAGGGGIPSFTPHVLLYSRRPSKHISASPACLSQPSYPVALPFTFDICLVAVRCFEPGAPDLDLSRVSVWKRAHGKGVVTGCKTCELSDYAIQGD